MTEWHQIYDLARERGMKEHFQLRPKAALIPLKDDSEAVQEAKLRANGQGWPTAAVHLELGELYMQRYATGDDFFKYWTAQGYHALLVQQTGSGYFGNRLPAKLYKILQAARDLRPWTFVRVEMWSATVFATEHPDDIKLFEPLLTKRMRMKQACASL